MGESKKATPGLVNAGVTGLQVVASLPRPVRRVVIAALDTLLCVAAIWLAFSLRLGHWQLFTWPVAIVAAVALPAWFLAAWNSGIYRAIIRSTGSRTMVDLAVACAVLAVPLAAVFMFAGIEDVPRTIAVLQPMVFLMLLTISRLVIRYLVVDVLQSDPRRKHRVLIYGAGRAGQQLNASLRHEAHLAVTGFIDDDERLAGNSVDGVRIHSATAIENLIYDLEIEEVLLAMPSASRSRRAQIVNTLNSRGVKVRSLPSIGNIIDGQVAVSDLREVQIEELLGRDAIPPDENLLAHTIIDSVVLVTGAGGSIGSELCRQIMIRVPKRLILVDNSEFALYRIDSELRGLGLNVEIAAELGDVADKGTAGRLLQRWRPDTVIHAAAYKHVPLVEANPVAGLRNNVFSTLNCCLAAETAGVGRFILVSTDKAVRPTNVMGASKRICELVLQARAAECRSGPIFSMVRFGNVLGSSGSVVPKFREQIAAGGPITVTHREVTRYFMTIPEASQLVLQAGAMAAGGEVFVLDMNEPIRIYDLARTMVLLSGLSVRDEANPAGDIEIREVGLRPGEKMYEELLIGENPQETDHPGILQARERKMDWVILENELTNLAAALEKGGAAQVLEITRRLVPEYASAGNVEGLATEAEALSSSMSSKMASRPSAANYNQG